MALEETATAATQEDPKSHHGMSEVPLFISANNLKECGNSHVEIQEYTHFSILEHHDCTALCKGFKEDKNPHPQTSLVILIQPSR